MSTKNGAGQIQVAPKPANTHGKNGGASPQRTTEDPTLLTADAVPGYLLDQGILAPAVLHDGQMEVHDLSRRNRNFRVILGDEGYLLKQPKVAGGKGLSQSLLNEGNFLAAIQYNGGGRLAESVPEVIHRDRKNTILITRLIHPATSLTKYHLNGGAIEFSPEASRSAARLLAEVHAFSRRAHRAGTLSLQRNAGPLALALSAHVAERARDGDEIASAYLARTEGTALGKDSGYLDRVRRAWSSREDVVHGDGRWDNYLLTHGAGRDGGLNLRLIDWELVALGDAAYDVATWFGEYVRFWAVTAGLRGARGGEDVVDRAAFDLKAARQSLEAFVDTYATARRLGESGRKALISRVCDHLPIYLWMAGWEMTSSWETKSKSRLISPSAEAMMDMAGRAAEDTRGALHDWFGMEVA